MAALKNIYFCIVTILLLNSYTCAQDTAVPALSLSASYTGDNFYNLTGGIKTGWAYLGMAGVCVSFDVERAGLWKGGSFFVHAANTHGSTPTASLFGDIQVVSNIEAGNHTYLQELWFRQKFRKTEITLGLQDLNVEFANSEYGSLYINSSFGILPVISANIPAPVFPLTTLGVTVRWNISEQTSWVNAVYDGSPTDFDYNPYNVKWQFISGDGILMISEVQHSMQIKGLPGTYKAGVYNHNHLMDEVFGKELPDSLNNNITGFYLYADQKIWERGARSAGVFVQCGYSPSRNTTTRNYLGAGINFEGLLGKMHNDVLGIAVARACMGPRGFTETAVELTWQKPVGKFITVQPDLQYIIDPSGTGTKLEDCLAGGLRVQISL